MAVNDLTVAPVATAFLGQFLSTDYFAASRICCCTGSRSSCCTRSI